MYKKSENLIAQWSDLLVDNRDEMLVVDAFVDYPREIIRVDMAMRALVKSKHKLFTLKAGPGGARLVADPIAKAVQECAKVDYLGIRQFYSKHKLSPYFELLASEYAGFRATSITGAHADVDLANGWVDNMRERASASAFTSLLSAQERSARKNARSLVDYINELFERHSRICVVRSDFAYNAHYRNSLAPGEIDPVRVKKDLAALLRLLRKKYPALVGYAWKLEYGQQKSYHIHFMAFFNGHEVWQDVAIGKALGELWRDEVTGGDGGYWNCNAQKSFYERRRGVGIGMVAHDEVERRKRLEYAALYLAKADYYVKLNEPSLARIFGKAKLAVVGDTKLGRPRQLAALPGPAPMPIQHIWAANGATQHCGATDQGKPWSVATLAPPSG
ncbi:inovirus-type Gp2 protein [Stenotrophomonas sp. HMWF023]|uniref:YagK/YfjJ domain-containing protein n=1 Tax=Stenotrophomonas sp. HMWF023 TaxID=2056859 RepID=UPI0015E83D16|nr:inovirus-type Gp2 protein [Stenotrophomonas sp. HMWF023]